MRPVGSGTPEEAGLGRRGAPAELRGWPVRGRRERREARGWPPLPAPHACWQRAPACPSNSACSTLNHIRFSPPGRGALLSLEGHIATLLRSVGLFFLQCKRSRIRFCGQMNSSMPLWENESPRHRLEIGEMEKVPAAPQAPPSIHTAARNGAAGDARRSRTMSLSRMKRRWKCESSH